MSIMFAFWRASFLSLRHGWLNDSRMRVTAVVTLVFSIAAGSWLINQLLAGIRSWQAQGQATVTTGLWSLCLTTWLGLGGIGLSGIQQALSGEEAMVQFTLPLSPAWHFRALIILFFIKNLLLFVLFQSFVLGWLFFSTPAINALVWLLLLQMGNIVAALVFLLAGLLFCRYLLPRERIKTRIGTAVIAGLLCLLVISNRESLMSGMCALLLRLRPERISALLFLFLILIFGPGAGACGRLYAGAFYSMQNLDRARKALVVPGVRLVLQLLSQKSNPMRALFTRAVLNQSRNLLWWLRLLMVWGLLLLFPLLHGWLLRYGIASEIQVVVYASALALLHIIETGASAFSGEGVRLTLYLTAPISSRRILYDRLALFLGPVLLESLVMGGLLCWLLALKWDMIISVVLLILLIVTGCTVLLIWGSAWDADLASVAEGAIERLLQEEGPFSPRRMVIFSACLACFAIMCLLIWQFSFLLALLIILLLDLGILLIMQKFAGACLQRLLAQDR